MVFTTIIVGVIVFIISQYVLKFILDPIKALKETLLRIDYTLQYYKHVYIDVEGASEESLNTFRKDIGQLAISLRSQLNLIPFYKVYHKLFHLPGEKELYRVVRPLIGMSNITLNEPVKFIQQKEEQIKKLLNIQHW